jgi:hypothetical protein
VAVRTQHIARPASRAVVVTDLASPCRPIHDRVELPLRLFWSSPDRSFDAVKLFTRCWLDETVLREASRPDDLTRYLNQETLIGLWPSCARRPACGLDCEFLDLVQPSSAACVNLPRG